jgi:hypothetical protein
LELTEIRWTQEYGGIRNSITPLTNNVSIISPDAELFNNDPTVNARGISGGYNHYDPVNKVYYLYYYYNSDDPRVIEETIEIKD